MSLRPMKQNYGSVQNKIEKPFSLGREIDTTSMREAAVDSVLPKSFIPEPSPAYPEPFKEEPALNKELHDFKTKINGEIEVFGLDKFDDSAIIIKGRIPTVHKQQWAVRREFNRRVKIAFDKNGIEIPFPQMTISYQETKKKKTFKKQKKRRQEFSPGSDDD